MTKTFAKRTQKAIAALSVSLVAVAGLSACGVGAQDGGEGSSKSAEVNADSVPKLPSRDDAPDPRGIKGLNTVSAVGDIQPVADSPEPKLPVEFRDATGEDVTVSDISRIVPLDLYGTLSKTVAGLGLAGNVVGRGVSSEEPIYKDLPIVTAHGHDINAEAVLQLKPTVVLVDKTVGPSEAVDQIREAGVSVAVIDPQRTVDSVSDDISLVANALGVRKEGKELGKRTKEELVAAGKEIEDLAPERPLRIATLYMRGENGVFFIMGNGSGSDETISALKGEDVATEQNIKNVAPANAEALAKLNPDVILVMEGGLESAGGEAGLKKRPGIAESKAGKNGRIIALPDSEAVSIGPQSGISLARFAEALYLGNDVQ